MCVCVFECLCKSVRQSCCPQAMTNLTPWLFKPHTHTHTHTYTHTHTDTHTHIHRHTHTHTHTHTDRLTHTHTYKHIHIHTHMCVFSVSLCVPWQREPAYYYYSRLGNQ